MSLLFDPFGVFFSLFFYVWVWINFDSSSLLLLCLFRSRTPSSTCCCCSCWSRSYTLHLSEYYFSFRYVSLDDDVKWNILCLASLSLCCVLLLYRKCSTARCCWRRLRRRWWFLFLMVVCEYVKQMLRYAHIYIFRDTVCGNAKHKLNKWRCMEEHTSSSGSSGSSSRVETWKIASTHRPFVRLFVRWFVRSIHVHVYIFHCSVLFYCSISFVLSLSVDSDGDRVDGGGGCDGGMVQAWLLGLFGVFFSCCYCSARAFEWVERVDLSLCASVCVYFGGSRRTNASSHARHSLRNVLDGLSWHTLCFTLRCYAMPCLALSYTRWRISLHAGSLCAYSSSIVRFMHAHITPHRRAHVYVMENATREPCHASTIEKYEWVVTALTMYISIR